MAPTGSQIVLKVALVDFSNRKICLRRTVSEKFRIIFPTKGCVLVTIQRMESKISRTDFSIPGRSTLFDVVATGASFDARLSTLSTLTSNIDITFEVIDCI